MTQDSMRGFTLLETLVAVSVIAIAMTGPLYTANRSLVAAETARDRLIASHLAQEGIEWVRTMRDYEYIARYQMGLSDSWHQFVSVSSGPTRDGSIQNCWNASINSAPPCTLDTTKAMGTAADTVSGKALAVCTSNPGDCAPLYPRASDGAYSWDANAAYKGRVFTRTIQVGGAEAGNDEKIVSKVTWSFYGTPYSVTVTDHLTPWQ